MNPFEHSDDSLLHLSSGVVANSSIKSDMKDMYQRGENAAVTFMTQQIMSERPDIYTPIKKTNLQTFTSVAKTIKSKNKKGEMVALKNSKMLFARMLLIAKSRNLDMQEVLCYSLRPYPRSLATNEGDLMKTTKSKFLTQIEAEVPDCHESNIVGEKAYIIDGMAMLQMLQNTSKTFNELAEKLLTKIINVAVSSNARRVDFVCDRYPAQSIENLERERRACSGSQIVRIYSEKQRVPRQWKKFLSAGENKEELMKFIFYAWQRLNPRLLRNVEVFLAHESQCHHLTASNEGIVCTEVEELRCDHEEADARMIVHAKHASNTYANVIIKSPDTDVFMIAVNTSLNIQANLFFFETGVSNLKRIISLEIVRQSIGNQWCSSLIGLHAFTGTCILLIHNYADDGG